MIEEINYDSLIINNHEIKVRKSFIKQIDLKFFPENPRIYSYLYFNKDQEPTQKDIEKQLIKLDHVKQLIQSIKANGGLIDPLIVKDVDNIVLEGNSRLAAYRVLAKQNPIKFGKVKCMILPKDIDESLIFALLGQYHIIGRKDWAPYEQAGYLWRRHIKHGVSEDLMAKEMGISLKLVKRLIDIYQFMFDNNELKPQRWSYYEEYFKSSKISNARKKYNELDDIVVQKIKSGEINYAIDIRNKLAKLFDVKGKKGENVINDFLSNNKTVDYCFEKVTNLGVTNQLYKLLNNFREKIYDNELKKELTQLLLENKQHYDKCHYEIKQIRKRLEKLEKLNLTGD